MDIREIEFFGGPVDGSRITADLEYDRLDYERIERTWEKTRISDNKERWLVVPVLMRYVYRLDSETLADEVPIFRFQFAEKLSTSEL